MGSIAARIFSEDENHRVLAGCHAGGKGGKHVELMVVPGSDPYQAVVRRPRAWNPRALSWGFRPSSRLPSRAPRWAATGSSFPSRGLRCLWRSCLKTKGHCVLNLGPILRRSGRRTRLSSPALAELSAKGPGPKLHHRDTIGRRGLAPMNAELHSTLRGSCGRRPARDLRRQP